MFVTVTTTLSQVSLVATDSDIGVHVLAPDYGRTWYDFYFRKVLVPGGPAHVWRRFDIARTDHKRHHRRHDCRCCTGAAIPGATVVVTNIQTGIGRTVKTNGAGGYRIESVQPGVYKTVVNAPSFATTTIEHTDVTASVITSINATLGIVSASATVEVGAVTAGLRTDSGEISDTLSNLEVQNLPITSLNPYELALTLPGVTSVTAASFTNGFAFSVDGNRPRDNNFLIEGADNNDQGIHGQAFQPQNLEAVDEITFLLSSFSPEYGGGGSVSNLIFQSGTNKFHGAIYERLFNLLA